MSRALATSLGAKRRAPARPYLLGGLAGALFLAVPAAAEPGLFALSLEGGVAAGRSDRGGALWGAMEYGVSERWAAAVGAGLEWRAPGRVASLGIGPRLTLVQGDWSLLFAFSSLELLAPLAAHGELDVAARLGLGARYQLLWGLGLCAQVSARALSGRWGLRAPSLEGALLVGLFIEA